MHCCDVVLYVRLTKSFFMKEQLSAKIENSVAYVRYWDAIYQDWWAKRTTNYNMQMPTALVKLGIDLWWGLKEYPGASPSELISDGSSVDAEFEKSLSELKVFLAYNEAINRDGYTYYMNSTGRDKAKTHRFEVVRDAFIVTGAL